MDEILSVRGLHTHYFAKGRVAKAVNGVTFSLGKGEIFGIAGESGSGKTTLALSLMRLMPRGRGRVVAGEVWLGGTDLLRVKDADMQAVRGARLAMIFQDPTASLDPSFTVGHQLMETVREHGGGTRESARRRAVELLTLVQISDPAARFDAYPHELSGGMQQRVMIAIAVSGDPDVLIADNPTTALDATIQLQILALLRDLQRRLGMSVIWITHDLGMVARVCDRVAVMYAGKLIETGSATNVLRRPIHPYTRGLLRSLPTLGSGEKVLLAIPGRHPEPMEIPPGCPFHPRCDFVHPTRCHDELPELREIRSGERAACHWAEEIISRNSEDRSEGPVGRLGLPVDERSRATDSL